MTARLSFINIGNKRYREFWPLGKPVTDGTVRCYSCGQIDESGFHEKHYCPDMGGRIPE